MSRRTIIRLLALGLLLTQLLLVAYAYFSFREAAHPLAPALAIALVVGNAAMTLALTRYLLKVLDRMEEAYAAEVEDELDHSLGGYLRAAREQEDDTRRLATEIADELELASQALGRGEATGVDSHLRQGLALATQARPPRCANATVSAILDSKERQCADAGVGLDAHAAIPAELPLPDIDLASILFNLIDNALHECEALRADDPVARPTIELVALVEAGQFMVSVSNPCLPGHHRSPAQRREETSGRHGWGTEIVTTLAERHGGIADLSREGDTFTARVMVPLA